MAVVFFAEEASQEMSDLPGPPEVDQPTYGAKLWPDHQETPHTSGAGHRVGTATNGPRRPRRTPTLAVIALAVGIAAFAGGFAVAGSTRGTTPNGSVDDTRTYEQGHEDGLEAGIEQGYEDGQADGFEAGEDQGHDTGFRLGRAMGREKGYRAGYNKGRAAGYRNGFVAGCQEVFDELDTNRVFDRQAGPYETYWYLTRDQCT
jgi:hypothetical protein